MKLNKVSQEGDGTDRSLRVDGEEFQVLRYHGTSDKEQWFHQHKDSYFRDPNNEVNGLGLRKLTLVIFLNDDID